MTGKIALALRIGLYVLAGALVDAGPGAFDPETGILTLDLRQIAELGAAAIAAGIALLWRKVVKRQGGVT